MTGVGTLSRSLSSLQVMVVTVGVATPGIQFACRSQDPEPPAATPQTRGERNPCPATPTAASFRVGAGATSPFGTGREKEAIARHRGRTVLDAIWAHRIGLERGFVQPSPSRAAAEDVGEIAVLQDEGDLVLTANLYDLRDVTLRFEPNGAGGYDVRRVGTATYRAVLGQQVALGDDDTTLLALPFEFPYYDRAHGAAFVNSDGNITFEKGDDASTRRDIARLLGGPPRVAPFLADLDPSSGGAVFAATGADAVTVTWCAVPEFDSRTNLATMQVSLLPNGHVEMTYDRDVTVEDAVVGLSPGGMATLEAVDLSEPGPASGGSGAIGERFSAHVELDLVAVASRFAASHPDAYDQLVIWTDRPVLFEDDGFAYEIGVANDIRGIGLPIHDDSADFGSEMLSSVVVMGWLGKYSDDRSKKVIGDGTTLGTLAHESGHRWLAVLEFSDHERERSAALLDDLGYHWSFFVDSDASVMGGNDIRELGGGRFETTAAVEGYSALDQYVMGLRHDFEVPPFYYVESPIDVSPTGGHTGGPRVGVTFSGTRRDVLIEDIIEVEGPRIPSADASPRVHRQAFLYVVGADRTAETTDVTLLDTIRRQWEAFFGEATEGRMRVETRLRTGPVPRSGSWQRTASPIPGRQAQRIGTGYR